VATKPFFGALVTSAYKFGFYKLHLYSICG